MARKKTGSTTAINLAPFFAAEGIPEPEREFQFAKPRKFAFDYAWPAIRLAVEKDGGIYGRGKPCPLCKRRREGAHTSIERLKSDQEKSNLAVSLGWRVLHFRPEQFNSREAFEYTANVFRSIMGRRNLGHCKRRPQP